MQFYLNKDISNIKSKSRPQTSSHQPGGKKETLEPTCPYRLRSNYHRDSISAGDPPPIAHHRTAPQPSIQRNLPNAPALPDSVGGGAEVEGRGGVGMGEPGGEAAPGGGVEVEVSGMANREAKGRALRFCRRAGGRSVWRDRCSPGVFLVEGVADRAPGYFSGEVGVDGVVRDAVQCGCEVYGEL